MVSAGVAISVAPASPVDTIVGLGAALVVASTGVGAVTSTADSSGPAPVSSMAAVAEASSA